MLNIQIYNSPKTEYTNRLIDAIPEGKLEDIKAHLEKKRCCGKLKVHLILYSCYWYFDSY